MVEVVIVVVGLVVVIVVVIVDIVVVWEYLASMTKTRCMEGSPRSPVHVYPSGSSSSCQRKSEREGEKGRVSERKGEGVREKGREGEKRGQEVRKRECVRVYDSRSRGSIKGVR